LTVKSNLDKVKMHQQVKFSTQRPFCSKVMVQRDTQFIPNDCTTWTILECGQMPNVMAALPNIGGGLCSTPQSLA